MNARRKEIPEDYLSRMKMAYPEDGATPSRAWYGWITGMVAGPSGTSRAGRFMVDSGAKYASCRWHADRPLPQGEEHTPVILGEAGASSSPDPRTLAGPGGEPRPKPAHALATRIVPTDHQ